MRQRVTSSIAIVAIGVLAIGLGGPVFAALMIGLGFSGFAEYSRMAAVLAPGATVTMGYATIVVLGVAAFIPGGTTIVIATVMVLLLVTLSAMLARPEGPGPFTSASVAIVGALYLGLPVFAAISLREETGSVANGWLLDLTSLMAIGWQPTPRGLAWTMLVVLVIWVGDSAAYLGGRAFGRRPLAPRISPKKTIEGSAAGLAGSALTAAIAVGLLGLDLPLAAALAIGVGLGLAGQVGDLIESMLKRQAGIKDSGAIIPGHGGILDRIDALLAAFPIAWITVMLLDGTLP